MLSALKLGERGRNIETSAIEMNVYFTDTGMGAVSVDAGDVVGCVAHSTVSLCFCRRLPDAVAPCLSFVVAALLLVVVGEPLTVGFA